MGVAGWYTLLPPIVMGFPSPDVGLFPIGVPERLSIGVLPPRLS